MPSVAMPAKPSMLVAGEIEDHTATIARSPEVGQDGYRARRACLPATATTAAGQCIGTINVVSNEVKSTAVVSRRAVSEEVENVWCMSGEYFVHSFRTVLWIAF